MSISPLHPSGLPYPLETTRTVVLDLGLYDRLRKSPWVQGRNPGRLGRGMGGPGGSGEGIETLPDPSGPSGARIP